MRFSYKSGLHIYDTMKCFEFTELCVALLFARGHVKHGLGVCISCL